VGVMDPAGLEASGIRPAKEPELLPPGRVCAFAHGLEAGQTPRTKTAARSKNKRPNGAFMLHPPEHS
jgi:hypothetical protein